MTAAMVGTRKLPLDWNRSFALGMAIAINLAALGALAVMQPTWQPMAVRLEDRNVIEMIWPEILPEIPEIPLAPTRNSAAIPQPVKTPPVENVVVERTDSIALSVDAFVPEAVTSTPADVPATDFGLPTTGIVADRDAGVVLPDPSSPPYPIASIRNREEGTVVLEVWVNAHGAATDVKVIRGSGHRALDRSAREHVLRAWTFQPALRDGKPIAARVRIPIAFSLDRG